MNRKSSTGRTVDGCAGRTWPPLKGLRPERYGMHFEASGPTPRDGATCSCIEPWRFAFTQTAPQDGPSPLLSKQTRQQQADEPLDVGACMRRTMPEGEAAVRRRTHSEVPRVSFIVVELGPSDRDAGCCSAQELWSVSRIDVVKRPED